MKKRFAVALSAPLFFASSIALADKPISLGWETVEGCPTRADVQKHVERFLGGPPSGEKARLSVEGQLKRQNGSFQLSLRMTGAETHGARVLDASNCATLSEAGALLVAMAFDPDAVSASAARAEQEPSSPILAPQTGAAALPSVPTGPSPAAPPIATPPTAQPSLPAWKPPPRGGALAPSGARSPMPARPWTLAGGLGFLGDYGSLPSVSPGVRAQLSLGMAAYRIEAAFQMWPSAESRLKERAAAGGTFSLVLGELRGCRILLPWAVTPPMPVSLAGCVGLEMGRIAGKGFGVTHPTEGAALWIAPTSAAELRVALAEPLGVLADVGFAVPLNRKSFVLQTPGRDLIHESLAVEARFGLGLDARF